MPQKKRQLSRILAPAPQHTSNIIGATSPNRDELTYEARKNEFHMDDDDNEVTRVGDLDGSRSVQMPSKRKADTLEGSMP